MRCCMQNSAFSTSGQADWRLYLHFIGRRKLVEECLLVSSSVQCLFTILYLYLYLCICIFAFIFFVFFCVFTSSFHRLKKVGQGVLVSSSVSAFPWPSLLLLNYSDHSSFGQWWQLQMNHFNRLRQTRLWICLKMLTEWFLFKNRHGHTGGTVWPFICSECQVVCLGDPHDD